MRVVFFAGGDETPAARYRVRQFIPVFERQGISCAFYGAYGSSYNRVAPTLAGPFYKLASRMKRALLMANVRGYDVVFLQRTALPDTALPELLSSHLNPRIIFDFDDAIYLRSDGGEGRLRARTMTTMARISKAIIVGNAHLAARVGHADKTHVIPTVIDTDRYTPGRGSSGERVVIGWMGTASNFDSLRSVLPALKTVLERNRRAVVRIVSNARLREVSGWERTEQRAWAADREIDDLRSFDIGIMPLLDNEMSRGKCGFKLILYMATGSPVVASPVGANVEIVAPGVCGFLSRSRQEWIDALEALIGSRAMRLQAGEAGRARVEGRYSVRTVAPRYTGILERVAAG